MTDEKKKKLIDWGTAYIGIPVVVLLTVAVMSGRKLEAIDILTKRVDCLTIKVDTNVALLSGINNSLKNIKEDIGELKKDVKQMIQDHRRYGYSSNESE